jgi:hypothetical protein
MEEWRKEAAKELEPKLLSLTEEHSLAIRTLREEVAAQLHSYRQESQRNNDLKLARLQSELASSLQKELSQASLDNDTRMEEMRSAYQLEISQVRPTSVLYCREITVLSVESARACILPAAREVLERKGRAGEDTF